MAREPETLQEKREREKVQEMLTNRKDRFVELLGADCKFIDALVIHTDISPWDVKELLDNGCPKELVPEILI